MQPLVHTLAQKCHFTRRAPSSSAKSFAAGIVLGGHRGFSALVYESHVAQAGDLYRLAFGIF